MKGQLSHRAITFSFRCERGKRKSCDINNLKSRENNKNPVIRISLTTGMLQRCLNATMCLET